MGTDAPMSPEQPHRFDTIGETEAAQVSTCQRASDSISVSIYQKRWEVKQNRNLTWLHRSNGEDPPEFRFFPQLLFSSYRMDSDASVCGEVGLEIIL